MRMDNAGCFPEFKRVADTLEKLASVLKRYPDNCLKRRYTRAKSASAAKVAFFVSGTVSGKAAAALPTPPSRQAVDVPSQLPAASPGLSACEFEEIEQEINNGKALWYLEFYSDPGDTKIFKANAKGYLRAGMCLLNFNVAIVIVNPLTLCRPLTFYWANCVPRYKQQHRWLAGVPVR